VLTGFQAGHRWLLHMQLACQSRLGKSMLSPIGDQHLRHGPRQRCPIPLIPELRIGKLRPQRLTVV
jgi:hypothetical protein